MAIYSVKLEFVAGNGCPLSAAGELQSIRPEGPGRFLPYGYSLTLTIVWINVPSVDKDVVKRYIYHLGRGRVQGKPCDTSSDNFTVTTYL